jgi:hypothetical protein
MTPKSTKYIIDELKYITSLELEQHHIIKLLYVKSFKLNDIAVSFSTLYRQTIHAKPSIKYRLQELKLERSHLNTQYDHEQPLLNNIDADINSGSSEFSVFSVWTIANCSVIPVQTIVFFSFKDMDLTILYFMKFPHIERQVMAETNRTRNTIPWAAQKPTRSRFP